jgi:hypothetical protein
VNKRGGAGAVVLAAASLVLLVGCATSAEPVPRGLSAAQRLNATKAELALRWAQVTDGEPSFTEPHLRIVRYTTYRDTNPTVAACLRTSGYPKARATAEGVIDPLLTSPEAFPFSVAKFRCESKYPEEPLELGYMTSAQAQYLYDYWDQQSVPCLRGMGAIVPDLRQLRASGLGFPSVMDVDPYLTMTKPRGVSLPLLEARCPPFPGELYRTRGATAGPK